MIFTRLTFICFLLMGISINSSAQDEIPILLEFQFLGDGDYFGHDTDEIYVDLIAFLSSPEQDIALNNIDIRLVFDGALVGNGEIFTVQPDYIATEISENEGSTQSGIDFFDFEGAPVFYHGLLNFLGGDELILTSSPQAIFGITLEGIPVTDNTELDYCVSLLYDQVNNDPGALGFDGVSQGIEVDIGDANIDAYEIVNHYGWDYGLGDGIFGGMDESEACLQYILYIFGVLEILDVDWQSFSAVQKDKAAILEWVTSSEISNSHFVIQRASDGKNFVDIGSVEGFGTTGTSTSYQFIDKRPLFGENYYRIKQIDFDGSADFSKVTVVSFKDNNEVKLNSFPNPAYDIIHVTVNGKHAMQMAYVYDMQGKLVKSVKLSLTDTNQFDINISDLEDGMYFLKMQDQNHSLISSIIKVK